MLTLDRLIVTQECLRKTCQIDRMVEHVRAGGFWTRTALDQWANKNYLGQLSPLIQIVEFEDGDKYVHDGHHRLVSTYLGGRSYLRSDEYDLVRHPYDYYLAFNPEAGWFTPFDPRTEVRVEDLKTFKTSARTVFMEEGFERAEEFARNNSHMYILPRTIRQICQLADYVTHFG